MPALHFALRALCRFIVVVLTFAAALSATREARGTPPVADRSVLWPAPLARDHAPLVNVNEPELARRPAEIFAAAGPMLFDCLPFVAFCKPPQAAPRISTGALWRAEPSFAWGGTLSVAELGDVGVGTTVIAALTARTYFADGGALDPYLQLSLGAGTYGHGTGSDATLRGRGLNVEVGGGVDVHLGRLVKLGTSLHYAQFVFGPARSCVAGVCRDQALGSVDPSRGFATLLVDLTVLAGRPL